MKPQTLLALVLFLTPSLSLARPYAATTSAPKAQAAKVPKVPLGLGKLLIDKQAPGAPAMLEAMDRHSGVVGLFYRSPSGISIIKTRIVNKDGVSGHKDLLPPLPDQDIAAWGDSHHVGGFFIALNEDGKHLLRPSKDLSSSSNLEGLRQTILEYFGIGFSVSLTPNFDGKSQDKAVLH